MEDVAPRPTAGHEVDRHGALDRRRRRRWTVRDRHVARCVRPLFFSYALLVRWLTDLGPLVLVWVNRSQVILSIVLPFIVFPLVWITSSNTMVVKVPRPPPSTDADPSTPTEGQVVESEEDVDKVVSFKNGWIMAGCGYLIFAVVVVANSYVIVSLGMGTAG